MLAHIEICKSNGRTVVAYCKEHGLAPSKFYYWQKRLKNNTAAGRGFTQISALSPMTATIHFPNGVHISFVSTVSTSVLKELVCCI